MQSRRRHRSAALLGLVTTALVALLAITAQAAPQGTGMLFTTAAADLAARHALYITAFGSSSTQGIGASSLAASYPSRLQAELAARLPAGDRVAVSNRGIGGEDVEDMMRRLPRILAEHPDLVIWQTGTNDPLRGVPLARFADLTRAGIALMRAAGIDVMLMEPQDCPVFAGKPGALAYRDAVRAIGAEFGVPVVRRYDLMEGWLHQDRLTAAQLQAPDGLHMSDTGYALLAKAVAGLILADIRAQPAPTPTARAVASPAP
jgi:lysophospholipase L1-like esterase